MGQTDYDYIIAGAGSSGLSLAWHLINSPLSEKRILIADQNLAPKTNKTWCFWHDEDPPFPEIIHASWQQTEIYSKDIKIKETLKQFPYYCILSKDFQQFILQKLREFSNIDLLETTIQQIQGDSDKATLQTESENFSAEYIFQSCFRPPQFSKNNIRYPLLQHFLGWEIETDRPVFNSESFILMDFDNSYQKGIAFIYLLPWSATKALMEYTIFSNDLEQTPFYEKKLELYLFNRFKLKRFDYSILRIEYGEIPMQDAPYVPFYAPRVVNMGTVGGLTKPSTGYTFARIQEHSKRIVDQLLKEGTPAPPLRSPFRYRIYDLLLLQIMHDTPTRAYSVFHELFTNNSVDSIFKFLSEKSSPAEDLKIMSSVPYYPFFKAIWETKRQLINLNL